jgi:hypothetical protein
MQNQTAPTFTGKQDRGIPFGEFVLTRGNSPEPALPTSGFGARDAASLGVDFAPLPFVGTAKSAVELVTGYDYIAGKPTSRVFAAVGMVAGILPMGKGLLKGATKTIGAIGRTADDVADVARVAGRVDAMALNTSAVEITRALPILESSVSVPRSTLRTADQIYGGVRQASKYLQEMGVSRAKRVEYLQAFDRGTISFRQAGASEYGLRYFGGRAKPEGGWLFETFPASRQTLALDPEWNSMTGFRQFQIVPGTPVIQGRAAAQGPDLTGGQIQKFILDWSTGLIQP